MLAGAVDRCCRMIAHSTVTGAAAEYRGPDGRVMPRGITNSPTRTALGHWCSQQHTSLGTSCASRTSGLNRPCLNALCLGSESPPPSSPTPRRPCAPRAAPAVKAILGLERVFGKKEAKGSAHLFGGKTGAFFFTACASCRLRPLVPSCVHPPRCSVRSRTHHLTLRAALPLY